MEDPLLPGPGGQASLYYLGSFCAMNFPIRDTSILTEAEILENNALYAEAFPTAFLPLGSPFSYRQATIDQDSLVIIPGSLTVKRCFSREQADLLTYLMNKPGLVQELIGHGLLSPGLARYFAALMAKHHRSVPMELRWRCMANPGQPVSPSPVHPVDRLSVLGLLFPGPDHYRHFKAWYEAGPLAQADDETMESMLLYPLIAHYAQYRQEYPEVTGIDLGRRSETRGPPGAPALTAFANGGAVVRRPDRSDDINWYVPFSGVATRAELDVIDAPLRAAAVQPNLPPWFTAGLNPIAPLGGAMFGNWPLFPHFGNWMPGAVAHAGLGPVGRRYKTPGGCVFWQGGCPPVDQM